MIGAVRSGLAFLVRLATGAHLAHPAEDSRMRTLPENAVYFANHSSHLDFLTIWAVLPTRVRGVVRPVAAADYWGSGVRGRLAAALFQPYLVSRGKGGPAAPPGGARRGSQVDGMIEVLDAGGALILFPEGTRGSGEALAPFHAGLARIAAARPDVPLIPVALANLGRMLPKGGIVPVPVLATVSFLASVTRASGEEEAAFGERVRGVLAAELAALTHEDDGETPVDGTIARAEASA